MFHKYFKSIFVKQNIIPLCIALLGLLLRLYKIDAYMTFLGDEGRDVLVVYGILHGDITLLGPTASVGGFFLGPIYYYLMAPALLFANYNPVGPAVMVALFGAATIWVIYSFANRFYGIYSAIIVSIIYAASPLVIIYSRSSWNPNTVPFFALVMLIALYFGIIKKSWKGVFTSGILFGILLQLHYLATFLGVIVFFYILISQMYFSKTPSKVVLQSVKDYMFYGLGVLVGWSPFLLFELRHGFANIKSIFKFVFSSGDTGGNTNFLGIVVDVFSRLFGRILFAFPRSEDMHLYDFPKEVLGIWQFAGIIIGVVCVGFLIYKLVTTRKDQKLFLLHLLFFIWLFFGVFLFGFYKKSIYDYYLGFMFPLPVLLLAVVLSVLLKKGKVVVFAVIVFTLFIVGLNLYMRPFVTQGNYQLNQVKQISEFVLSKTDGKPFNFAVISGGNSDHAYRFFFAVHDQLPTPIQYEGADPERDSVTEQLLVVCESLPCEPVGHGLWEIAGFGQAEIVGEWDVSVVKVYKLEHSSREY